MARSLGKVIALALFLSWPGASLRRLRHFELSFVLLWAAVPLSAADLHFSHWLHLTKAAAECSDCHSSVTTSTLATDRNIPSEENCFVCHDGKNAGKPDMSGLATWQTAERSYRFNHQLHLELGNVAPLLAAAIDGGSYLGRGEGIRSDLYTEDSCRACHRGMRDADLASDAHLPYMADCLVCHSEIDNPFSCAKCHLEGAKLKPADHTTDFVDSHASGKVALDKSTCLPCHGTNFTCKGCH